MKNDKLIQELEALKKVSNTTEPTQFAIDAGYNKAITDVIDLIKQQPDPIEQLKQSITSMMEIQDSEFKKVYGHDRNPDIGYYLNLLSEIEKHRP